MDADIQFIIAPKHTIFREDFIHFFILTVETLVNIPQVVYCTALQGPAQI